MQQQQVPRETVARVLSEHYRELAINSPREEYSISRALLALCDHADISRIAPREYEASQRVAKRMGRGPLPGHLFVPLDAFTFELTHGTATRALTVGTASAGGYLVETTTGGLFLRGLKAASVMTNMGVDILPAVGNVSVPRTDTLPTAYWIDEVTPVTESQPVFAQVPTSPKTVGAYCECSRQLAIQAPVLFDRLILPDIGAAVGAAVDAAIMAGTGASGQPKGIIGTTGVGSVTGTSLAWAGLLEFQTDVLGANAVLDGTRFGYVSTPTVAALLAGRQRFTGTDSPLWQGSLINGSVAGCRAMSTNGCPSGKMIAGDWSCVRILDWGGLEIGINEYANFQAGTIGIRAVWSMDVGVSYPSSFSVASTIT